MRQIDDKEAAVLYGADATEWLARWDRGDLVWTIEMGGLGPAYEQALQVTAAEMLRDLLARKPDHTGWQDQDKWKAEVEIIDANGYANPIIKKVGPSGAQWGAAMAIASRLYMKGPMELLRDPALEKRHIQVRKSFPNPYEAA